MFLSLNINFFLGNGVGPDELPPLSSGTALFAKIPVDWYLEPKGIIQMILTTEIMKIICSHSLKNIILAHRIRVYTEPKF